MLKLVKFNKTFVSQLNEMMDEWTAANEKIIPFAINRCNYHDIDRYIDSLEFKEPQGNYVPDSTFFCLDTERNIFVGAVNIRHDLNDWLPVGGGDMNGIALLLPEWVARVIFGILLFINGFVFWKRVLPVYRQSFAGR